MSGKMLLDSNIIITPAPPCGMAAAAAERAGDDEVNHKVCALTMARRRIVKKSMSAVLRPGVNDCCDG
jgi:hypothetical protein